MTPPRAIPSVEVHLDDDRRVAVISPRGPVERTVVALLGYRASLDPFEVQRFALIAHETSSRVVVPENAGCGIRSVKLPLREVKRLACGDFGPMARRTLRQVAPWTDGDGDVHLLGYSMGASIGAALLSSAEFPQPVTTTLVEPVAATTWNVRRLLRAMQEEERATNDFLDANDGWVDAALPWDRTPGATPPAFDRVTLAASGLGVARGRLLRDLIRARAQSASPRSLVLVRGADSALCTQRSIARLRETLSHGGIASREIVVAGRHAMWHSLDAVRSLSVQLVEVWRQHEQRTGHVTGDG